MSIDTKIKGNLTMSDNEIFQIYTNLLPFLGKVLGPSCELCIHDIRNPDKSIIAIENSATGRQIGYPMTDFAYTTMEQGMYTDSDSILNYEGSSKGKPFLSSTYFIKNEDRLIGLFCINKDMSATNTALSTFQNLLSSFNLTIPENSEFTETLEGPVSDLLPNLVADAIAQTNVLPERMTLKERVALVHKLNEQGILSMKGAVKEIASQLNISEPTVYRYLNRKDND